MIETNGFANPITFIRLYKLQHPNWQADAELKVLFERIEAQCWAGISYIQELENPNNVRWLDHKPKELENERVS